MHCVPVISTSKAEKLTLQKPPAAQTLFPIGLQTSYRFYPPLNVRLIFGCLSSLKHCPYPIFTQLNQQLSSFRSFRIFSIQTLSPKSP